MYVLIGLAFANVYELILLYRPGALLYQNLPAGILGRVVAMHTAGRLHDADRVGDVAGDEAA